MILTDFICPVHGTFEATVDSDTEFAPCTHAPVSYSIGPADGFEGPRQYFTDRCGLASPWSPSPVIGRVAVSATRGKSDRPPTKQAANTLSTIGEGQRYGEWRNDRRKMWSEYDEKRRR